MSADNGYIIRKNAEQKFVLQHYFASAEAYPDVEKSKIPPFECLGDALDFYDDMEVKALNAGYPLSEYGLTVSVR